MSAFKHEILLIAQTSWGEKGGSLKDEKNEQLYHFFDSQISQLLFAGVYSTY